MREYPYCTSVSTQCVANSAQCYNQSQTVSIRNRRALHASVHITQWTMLCRMYLVLGPDCSIAVHQQSRPSASGGLDFVLGKIMYAATTSAMLTLLLACQLG